MSASAAKRPAQTAPTPPPPPPLSLQPLGDADNHPIRHPRSGPLVQHVVHEMLVAAHAALAHEAAGAGAASGERHAAALRALAALASDYAGELARDLYRPLALLAAGPAPPVLARPGGATAENEAAARWRLAERYGRKLGVFMKEWHAYLQAAAALPAATAGPAAQLCAQWHRQWGVYEWLLAHVQQHRVSGEAILVASADGVARSGAAEAVLGETTALYAAGVLPFPFKRQYLDQAVVDAMMARLRRFVPVMTTAPRRPHNIRFASQAVDGSPLLPLVFLLHDDVKKNSCMQAQAQENEANGKNDAVVASAGQPSLTFVHDDRDYLQMDVLVDFYQEAPRLNAWRQDAPGSVLQQWQDPLVVRRILDVALRKYGKIDPYTLREVVYEELKECTQFKPSLALGVIRLFGARRVLDFSAGWGDRLAGAIAAEVECYWAYDPNTALRPGHAELVRRYVESSRQPGYNVTYTSFEEAPLPDGRTFDLVFTSPPFFDFEIYSNLPGQSTHTYKKLESWVVRFLFHCLRRAWAVLEDGGHVVVHLTDVYTTKVCEKMCLLMLWQLPGAQYGGVLCSSGSVGKPRPMWVFRKRAEQAEDKEMKAQAEAELQRLYPETWEEANRYLFPVVVATAEDDDESEDEGGARRENGDGVGQVEEI